MTDAEIQQSITANFMRWLAMWRSDGPIFINCVFVNTKDMGLTMTDAEFEEAVRKALDALEKAGFGIGTCDFADFSHIVKEVLTALNYRELVDENERLRTLIGDIPESILERECAKAKGDRRLVDMQEEAKRLHALLEKPESEGNGG